MSNNFGISLPDYVSVSTYV